MLSAIYNLNGIKIISARNFDFVSHKLSDMIFFSRRNFLFGLDRRNFLDLFF
jgi:hypothetical protein